MYAAMYFDFPNYGMKVQHHFDLETISDVMMVQLGEIPLLWGDKQMRGYKCTLQMLVGSRSALSLLATM